MRRQRMVPLLLCCRGCDNDGHLSRDFPTSQKVESKLDKTTLN